MPIRKVVRPTGRGVRGKFPSRKMGRMIEWESLLERDAILRFEFMSNVIGYEEQPRRVTYQDNGVTHIYIPDFEVIFDTGEIAHIEVKPAKKLSRPDIARKYSAIAEHYASIGITFQLLTEKELREDPLHSNLKFLAQHLPNQLHQRLESHLQSLHLLPANTIAGAIAVCGSDISVYRLLAAGQLVCDLHQPLSSTTAIRFRESEGI